jgi:hypothetical protein
MVRHGRVIQCGVVGRVTINIDDTLEFAGLLAMAIAIALLFYRRISRTLPVFCAYCIWDLTSNISVYLIGQYYVSGYLRAYFAQTILDSAFLLCVLVELAWSVLRPLRSSLPRSAMVLVGVLILVAGAAIWPFAALPGLVHAASREWLLLIQLQHTVSILRILFFLLLAGGSQLLSIGWRDRELQIATGLGVFSIVDLTVAVLQTHQATESYHNLNRIAIAGYGCCLVYWVFSFAQKEAERREFTPQMQRILLAAAGAARSTRIGLDSAHEDKPRNPKNR